MEKDIERISKLVNIEEYLQVFKDEMDDVSALR